MLRLSFVGLLVGWMLLGSGCVPDDSGPGAKKLQGNAQRVERGLIPQALEEIYTYSDPTSVTYYPNVFRMSEGRIISIFLRAKVVPNGNFTGDEVAIANLTDARSIRGGTLQLTLQRYLRAKALFES